MTSITLVRTGGQITTAGYFTFVHASEIVHFILMTLLADFFASDFMLASLPIPIEFDVKHRPNDS